MLDEPTTGLHPSDVDGSTLSSPELLEDGATSVVVEHNLRVVAQADHVIDIGPGAGSDGGRLAAACTPAALAENSASATGRALAAAAESWHTLTAPPATENSAKEPEEEQ